ncbi:MAG: DUF2275 domain-containing protein [Candidatus Manganitrophus sp. SA1]|nr:DUF2275 domain-containing protein [Candidatus Manganitrophus morganii]
MNCDQIQEQLSEYLDNRLEDADRRRAIEDHLASCPRCLPEAKQLRDGIKGVAGLPEVELPAGFSQRVMARVREEGAGPTLWERLFQPLRIKIPLHATALLLVVGLAVFLYRANEPMEQMAQSIPSEAAPALKQAPPAVEESKSADTAGPPAAPSEQLLSDSLQAPPEGTDKIEPSARQDRAASAPAPAQEKMAFKEAESGKIESETGLPAGAPLPERGEQRTAEALPKRESPSPPDILLTLLTRGKADGPMDLSAKVREIVQRSGGTLHPAAERDDPNNAKPRFRLDLPKSEYSRFKSELTQVGEIISESQPSSPPPQTGAEPSSSMRIELTFLFDKSKETGAAGPPPAK